MTSWDFSQAPELREVLVDLLADALVAHVERLEAAEATTGATPTGNARTAEEASAGEDLGTAVGAAAAPRSGRAARSAAPPASSSGSPVAARLRAADEPEQAASGWTPKPARRSGEGVG
jgi:hypothetical protein